VNNNFSTLVGLVYEGIAEVVPWQRFAGCRWR
jgi:hypothetical protein